MTMAAKTGHVAEAVRVLRGGGVIAMPTDTLYALAAPALHDAAVARVYAIKSREAGKPLPLFVNGIEAAERVGEFTPLARELARRFWPGPLTLVVRRKPGFESAALAGSETVALRQPGHPIAQAVLDAFGGPLTGTSANRSGGPDPVSAEEVVRQLGGDVDFVIDAGPCPVGVSSTVLDCTGAAPVVLREGAISEEQVRGAGRAGRGRVSAPDGRVSAGRARPCA